MPYTVGAGLPERRVHEHGLAEPQRAHVLLGKLRHLLQARLQPGAGALHGALRAFHVALHSALPSASSSPTRSR